MSFEGAIRELEELARWREEQEQRRLHLCLAPYALCWYRQSEGGGCKDFPTHAGSPDSICGQMSDWQKQKLVAMEEEQ